MRTIITALVISLGLNSCSCNFHMRKARGKCGYTSDTVRVMDTIIISKTKFDTAFGLREIWHDTMVIVKGKDTYHFFYDTVKRNLNFKHDRDTIRVPYEKTIIKNNYNADTPIWAKALLWLFGLLLVMILGVWAWSKLKPKVAEQLNK